MFPVLATIGGVPIPAYAVFMALGFLAALAVVILLTPQGPKPAGEVSLPQVPGGLDRPQVIDLYIVMLVSAIIGSKWGHVLFEAPSHFPPDAQPTFPVLELLVQDPWHWARIDEAGYVWYGGMLACLGMAVMYFRRRPHLNGWLFSDLFAPAVMIGAFLGRVGCFFAGCCYGEPTSGPFGVQFPKLPGPVHPTQLYDATAAVAIGMYLLWRFPRRRFDGENIAVLLMAYPIVRALTEVFRGDPERGAFLGLSTSQWISIPLFVIGLVLFLRRRTIGQLTVPESSVPTPDPTPVAAS